MLPNFVFATVERYKQIKAFMPLACVLHSNSCAGANSSFGRAHLAMTPPPPAPPSVLRGSVQKLTALRSGQTGKTRAGHPARSDGAAGPPPAGQLSVRECPDASCSYWYYADKVHDENRSVMGSCMRSCAPSNGRAIGTFAKASVLACTSTGGWFRR